MTLHQIRDTVRHADFGSEKELRKWMRRAFGSDVADLYRAFAAARRGLQGQPLRGETYVVLAGVGFLAQISSEEEQALIQQAVRLRPHKPPVLYAAGSLAADAGDMDQAFAHWKTAFAKDADIRRQLVRRLAPHLSADEVIARLEPDGDGLRLLFHEFGRLDRQEQKTITAQRFAAHFGDIVNQTQNRDSEFWVNSYTMHEAIGADEVAVQCLKQALQAGPRRYSTRRQLTFALIDRQQFDAALEQLEWCLLRHPDDEEVRQVLGDLRARLADRKAGTNGRRRL